MIGKKGAKDRVKSVDKMIDKYLETKVHTNTMRKRGEL